MAELRQSVVVCNPEGRILLYNAQARDLFRRLSRAPEGAAGAELIGLGRSIHSVIERPLIAHALEMVERRIAGGGDPAPSARFVTTTPAGHLIRVNLAPVRREDAAEAAPEGFVLILDDITEEYEAESRRDRQVLELAERGRASLGNMQAALDVLEYPDLDAAQRDRLGAVVRDEVAAMSGRLAAFAAETSQDLMTRWPLQDMLGADLLAAAQQRIAADHGATVALEGVDPTLWLRVDSFALIRALAFLAGRLVGIGGPTELRLRLSRAGGRAQLDLAWSATAADPELARGWQDEPMDTADGSGALSVRDVVVRHDGELWIERDRDGGPTAFRLLLPMAVSAPAPALTPGLARPEYYDFDLFAVGEGGRLLDERLLSELAYTVIDTETTGLNPAEGDEIIQIGATRIVNGRLLVVWQTLYWKEKNLRRKLVFRW
jgi:DNA polymerase-3 subunit epsilon